MSTNYVKHFHFNTDIQLDFEGLDSIEFNVHINNKPANILNLKVLDLKIYTDRRGNVVTNCDGQTPYQLKLSMNYLIKRDKLKLCKILNPDLFEMLCQAEFEDVESNQNEIHKMSIRLNYSDGRMICPQAVPSLM